MFFSSSYAPCHLYVAAWRINVVAVRFERFGPARRRRRRSGIGVRRVARLRDGRRDDAVRTENCATLCVFTLLFISSHLRVSFSFCALVQCNIYSCRIVLRILDSFYIYSLWRGTPSLRRDILICPYAYCSRVDSLLGCVGRPQSILLRPGSARANRISLRT